MRTQTRSLLAAALLLTGASALAAPAEQRVRYDGHKVVAVRIDSGADLDRMAAFSDDPWSCEPKMGAENLYRVSPAQFDALAASGIQFRVEFEDVQTLIDAERAEINRAAPVGVDGVSYFAAYRDYATTSAYIDTLVALNPAIASRFTVGNSLEGREIFGVRITGAGAPGNTKPGFWIESIQHAREWAVLPANMWAADQLIRLYGVDPTVTSLVDSIDFYIVPIVNPDGYVYTWGPDRLWRKNRRPNTGGSFGVDLNRNWGFQWGGTGSSGTPSSETYRGPAAFSEPETLNTSNYIAARPHIRGLIDFHSNGQVCIFPWGYTNDPCPDHAEMNTLGTSIAAAIQSVNGIYCPPGSSGAVLYLASGNVRDWAYGARNIRPTTLEVRTGSSGFTPPTSAIAPTNAENWAGVLAFADWVKNTNPVRLSRTVGDVLSVGVNTPTPVQVKAATINGPTPGLAQPAALRWRTGSSGPFASTPLSPAGADTFTGSLPNAGCVPGAIEYYFEGQAFGGETATLPAGGAAAPLRAPVGVRTTVFSDNFETALGWTLGGAGVGDTATAGLWGRFNPISNAAQPEDDNPLGTGTFCYITSNGATNGQLDADVDNGITTITSPLVDGSGSGTLYVSYYRWFSNNLGANRGQPSDTLLVQISNNNAGSWTTVETVSENTGKWTPRAFRVSDFVAPTNQMRIRFRANDTSGDSCVEAGIDDVVFFRVVCDSIPGDVNGDGLVNFADLNLVLSNFGQTGAGIPGDADGDGDVDFADLNIVLSNFGTGADGLAAHAETSRKGGGG